MRVGKSAPSPYPDRMSIFEFIMTLQSIIVGLAAAEVLTGIAGVIRKRHTRPPSALHTALALGILLSIIQLWWESWSLRVIEEWSVPMLLLFMTTPTLIFVLAHMIFPESEDEATYERYYLDNARIIWFLIGVTMASATAFRPLVMGEPWFAAGNLSSLLTVGLGLALAITTNEKFHRAAVPVVMLALVVDIFIGAYSIS